MRRFLSLTVLLGIVLGLVSCATTGPGGRHSLIIIPTSQEVAIGSGMAEQLAESEKFLDDSLWQQYINEVGQRIVKVCDRRDITYHFAVIESDQVNAFAAPGGWIYIYTGLLSRMDNEAEMAAVLSHEVSHVVARHGVKRLQKALGFALAYQLVFGDNPSKATQAAVGTGMGLLFAGYSRDAEREADRFGFEYMTRVGYDPHGAVTMFEKLAAIGGAGSANVFEKLSRSHPETQERIANARAWIRANQARLRAAKLTFGTERYQKMRLRLPALPVDSSAATH
ncbi:MAG: peptidase M48 [Candidatus Zixiibacteriota bacterium]|nr:MAG: peptidase M48 [candidate division Zixibacteria bacterium]